MKNPTLTDTNIEEYLPLVHPDKLKIQIPITDEAIKTVGLGRQSIEAILSRADPRKIILAGPCSVHDPSEALEYAHMLKGLSQKVEDQFFLVMRVYLEKPRSDADSWEGLIYDPNLDGSKDINRGFYMSRKLLLQIGELGLPVATELLGVFTPQYICDLVTYAAIGARTTESPLHKKMASGISMPVGFKNNTAGDILSAVKAAKAATYPQTFVGINLSANARIIKTRGNQYAHIILRGGNGVPNYDPNMVDKAINLMKQEGLLPNVIIDCSHGNTSKKWWLQPAVFQNVMEQIRGGNTNLVGLMIESYIEEGKQELSPNSELAYGLSITDDCIGWKDTEELILDEYRRIKL